EEGVGRLLVEIVGVIDDGDLTRAAGRFEREATDQGLDDGDGEFLLVLRHRDLEEIRVRTGIDKLAGRAGVARVPTLRGPFAQQRLREMTGKQAFADAGGANEEIGVSQATATRRSCKGFDPSVVAADRGPGHDRLLAYSSG